MPGEQESRSKAYQEVDKNAFRYRLKQTSFATVLIALHLNLREQDMDHTVDALC